MIGDCLPFEDECKNNSKYSKSDGKCKRKSYQGTPNICQRRIRESQGVNLVIGATHLKDSISIKPGYPTKLRGDSEEILNEKVALKKVNSFEGK